MSTHPFRIIKPEAGGVGLKTRKLELGTKNLVGARVTQARLARGMKQIELLAQLQLSGVDLSVPALSLLEGQKRPVTDKELCALADALHVSVDWLLDGKSGAVRLPAPDFCFPAPALCGQPGIF